MKDDYKITFIRGATTASGNSIEEIEFFRFEFVLLKFKEEKLFH